MSKDSYLGITESSTSLYKQSGSKFMGYLFPIKDLNQLKNKLSELREMHPDATHICYAYILGLDRNTTYFTDDGEPSNSSGRPILNALLSSSLSYVMCAVVRYYGGKKLGIPGLIQSYGQAASECIVAIEIKELKLMDELICTIAANQQHLLFNFLNKQKDLNYEFNDGQFSISCSQSMTSVLRTELLNLPTLALIE
ncbi:MAG: YigZ family protein [Bacteroidia bacterium]